MLHSQLPPPLTRTLVSSAIRNLHMKAYIEELRPTTNLVRPQDLMLPTALQRSGFMHFYSGAAYGGRKLTSLGYWLRMFFAGYAPKIVYDDAFAVDRVTMRTLTHQSEKQPYDWFTVPKGLMSVTKVLPHNGLPGGFDVSFPVFRVDGPEQVGVLLGACFNFKKLGQAAVNRISEFNAELGNIDLASVVLNQNTAAANVRSANTEFFKMAFKRAGFVEIGGKYVAMVEMHISDKEAAQLTATPFQQIRPGDMYSVLMSWAKSNYGLNAPPPIMSYPIKKIGATMSDSGLIKPRVNSEWITIDAVGDPLLIPRKLNATNDYDEAYMNAGNRGNGRFQLINEEDSPEEITRRKLKPNMPVLTDWQNNKFSYTDTKGDLKVLDLAQCRAPNETQLVRLAEREFDAKLLDGLASVGAMLNVRFHVTPEDLEGAGVDERRMNMIGDGSNVTPTEYVDILAELFIEQAGFKSVRMCDLMGADFKPFQAVGRFLREAGKLALQNMPAVYARYSVTWALEVMPWFIIIGMYSEPSNLSALKEKDKANRQVYEKQGADPNWNAPLPLISDKFGEFPHQKRIRNQLRGHPLNAILPVDAGGGKTPSIVADILHFINSGKAYPYLIMCPSHLVAQYVTEINNFTDGKLNAVPINTNTLQTNGFDRVREIVRQSPRNTVVVVDYDVCARIERDPIVYGTQPIVVYHVIELLRQFNFQYVACDEVQYLRNATNRKDAVEALIVDIPYKRMASGTMAHDSMSDLANQLGIMDPTMFGSRENFNNRFGKVVKGNRVVEWKTSAIPEIKSIIRSNIVECRAQRKEWAALLPERKEFIHVAKMSEEQRKAYDALMDDTLKTMQEKAKTNPKLAKWLQDQDNESTGDVAEDEIQAQSIEQLLKKYLGRVERFCTAMGRDDWAKTYGLQGDDLVSPKIEVIVDIIKKHIADKIPGKIIVFTNYVWSAEAIYKALPPEIKSRFVHYKASQKVPCLTKFNSDQMIGMVGVSQSMDTGLNLQAASRLIRDGLVWNPGTLEQGDARIGRPKVGASDPRKYIYYDTVVLEDTIDITKLARIYSKSISVEKYNNAGNPRYATIEEPEVIKMSWDSITAFRNTKNEYVTKCIQSYAEFKNARDDDYAEYRAKYTAPDGTFTFKLEPIQHAQDPKDAALLAQTLYIPGGNVPQMDQLGLIRLDQFLNDSIDIESNDSGEEDDEEDEDTGMSPEKTKEWIQAANDLVQSARAHTSSGDGEIQWIGKLACVKLDKDGATVLLPYSTVFIMEKDIKGDIRAAMAKSAGIVIQKNVEVPDSAHHESRKAIGQRSTPYADIKQIRRGEQGQKPGTSQEDAGEDKPLARLALEAINGYLCLQYIPEDGQEDDAVVSILQTVGFKRSPAMKVAKIPNFQSLLKQFQLWADNDFIVDPKMSLSINTQFQELYMMLRGGKLKNKVDYIRYASKSQLQNFLRTEFKPLNAKDKETGKTVFRPIPLVIGTQAFIALPMNGQMGTQLAINHKAPGIKWATYPSEFTMFTMTAPNSRAVIKRLQENGLVIENLQELLELLPKIRVNLPIRKDAAGLVEL